MIFLHKVLLQSFARLCGHDLFTERLEDLLSVVVEAAFDLLDALILDDPQRAVGVAQQPLVVRHDHNTCRSQSARMLVIIMFDNVYTP